MSVPEITGFESDPLVPSLSSSPQNAGRWQFPKLEIPRWTSSIVSAIANCGCISLCGQEDATHAEIKRLWSEKPSNEGDFFEPHVHQVLKVIAIQKITNTLVEEIHREISANIKGSVFTLLNQLHRFQREFPEVFAECGYQKLVDRLETVVEEYGLSFREPEPSQDYRVFRPMSEFEGERLVLGCGYAYTSCEGHDPDKDYLVTIQEEMQPDLCADYYSSEFWNEFPDDTFDEVFFEGFLPDPEASSLQQIARILRRDGTVRMGWEDSYLGVLHWVHQVNPEAFHNYIRECGFSDFMIHAKYYCSVDTEMEHDELILIK